MLLAFETLPVDDNYIITALQTAADDSPTSCQPSTTTQWQRCCTSVSLHHSALGIFSDPNSATKASQHQSVASLLHHNHR
jgi:hypothetical protein